MCHQPAQTLFVAADAAVYLFCLPVFQLVHPIRVCKKLTAHGGALDASVEKLLLHKIRVVQAAHPANGEIGILTHFVAELEETTGMTEVRVVCRRDRIFQRMNDKDVKHKEPARKQAVLLIQRQHSRNAVLSAGQPAYNQWAFLEPPHGLPKLLPPQNERGFLHCRRIRRSDG